MPSRRRAGLHVEKPPEVPSGRTRRGKPRRKVQKSARQTGDSASSDRADVQFEKVQDSFGTSESSGADIMCLTHGRLHRNGGLRV